MNGGGTGLGVGQVIDVTEVDPEREITADLTKESLTVTIGKGHMTTGNGHVTMIGIITGIGVEMPTGIVGEIEGETVIETEDIEIVGTETPLEVIACNNEHNVIVISMCYW